ncbi:MAG: DUF58 domain-containing protein [Neptuniibacter sp.]
MFGSIVQPITSQFQKWASNRRPRGKQIELNQKRIFIFPTAAGWAYLMLCIIIFLVGTNYQNNLIHAVAFLLISLGILSIHYTFLNLSGLRITVLKGYNCYEEDLAEFSLQLNSGTPRDYHGLQLSWQGEVAQSSELEKGTSAQVQLYAKSKKRGVFTPEALLIETRYPFGLLRAWSWMEPGVSVYVYPKPLKGKQPVFEGQSGDGRQPGQVDNGDDFGGLNEYQPGDSSRRIAWKQFAQGRGLLTKQYIGNKDRRLWLNWDSWPELGTETRLSVICYWAQQLEYQGIEYGLLLPGVSIPPGSGPSHLEQILISLARYSGNKSKVML